MGIEKRGFASMDPEKRRHICQQAGRASHACKKGHEWTPAEAAAAGRKGGTNSAKAARLKRELEG